MKKLRKKLMALTMAGALACTPVTAFAAVTTEADGTITGSSSDIDPTAYTGSVAGDDSTIVDAVTTDIVKVVLPTADTATKLSTLQFTMDPQLLISQAIENGATDTGYSDVQENATILFKNTTTDASGTTTSWSDTSDPITITNKGTIPIAVTLTPKVTFDDNGSSASKHLTSPTNGTFSNNGTPEIKLTLNDGTSTGKKILPSTESTFDPSAFELSEAPEGAYKATYSSGNYTYDLVDDFDETLFDKKEFTITGEASSDSAIDWVSVKTEKAAITLAWSIAKGTTFSGTKPVFDGTTTIGKIAVTDGTDDYQIGTIDSAIATINGKTYDLKTDYALDVSDPTNGMTFNASGITSSDTYARTGTVSITYTTAGTGANTGKTKQITTDVAIKLK